MARNDARASLVYFAFAATLALACHGRGKPTTAVSLVDGLRRSPDGVAI